MTMFGNYLNKDVWENFFFLHLLYFQNHKDISDCVKLYVRQ